MNNNKTIILTLVGVLTLLIAIVGATYAYFTAVGSTGTEADVSVGTSKEDILTFEVGSDINIEVNQTTFASGKGNTSGTTFGKAILTTANQENELRASYNLYLNIIRNELSYTSSDNTPELLLKVTDSSGTELTSISGLDYKEVTDGLGNTVKGFDITTKTGLITILNNQEIKAQPTKTDTWNVEVIFVNYNFDQTANAGKSVKAYLQMNKGEYKKTIAELCDGKTLSECIKAQYTTQGENNLYLHNSSLANSANDGSYRYAGSSDTTNNYVCFGSDKETCPTDNLYRIIGVFGDQVKLIKADYATSTHLGTDGAYASTSSTSNYSNYKGSLSSINYYYWTISGRYNNVWSESTLNITNLNTNYIAYLNKQNAKWTNMIAESSWKVGGIKYYPLAEIGTVQDSESQSDNTTYSAKIGLMYIRDYGYATSPSAWTKGFYEYASASVKETNWMYMGVDEWTITRVTDWANSAFFISGSGSLYIQVIYEDDYGDVIGDLGVRPCFYLTSSVKWTSGSGTSSDPYRLSL